MNFQAFFDVVKAAAPIIGKVIGAAFSVAGTVASTVFNLISNVLGALKTIINTAIDGINLVIRGLNLIKPGPDIASIGKIGSSTGSSSTGGISVPRASLPSGFKPAATVTTKPTVTVTPTITPTPVATVAASAAAAAKAAAANTAVSSNFNPGRFRMGEEADRVGTTINLTVNGASIPKAQLARLSILSTILIIAAQVVQLTRCNLHDTFQPGLESDHWRCAIHNSHFGQSNYPQRSDKHL
jgi:hypothetical protein